MNRNDLIQQAIGLQKELNRLTLEYSTKEWMSLDLTIAQLKSIIYIYGKEKASFKELAGALNVTPSVVTGVVDRLIQQGMVKRKRIGTSVDRRVQWLIITDKAKTLLDNIRRQTIDNSSQILEALSDEELSDLVQGFSALIRAVEPNFENRNKVTGITVDSKN